MVRSDKKKSSKSSSSRSTHSTLPRLPVKEEIPTGIPVNGPPIWQRLPLDAKLPMVAGTKDYVVLSRRYALSSLYVSFPNQPFDLTDPYNRISPRYDPLHDPHVKDFVTWEDHFRALQKQGLITPSGHVICTVRELNEYRRYLHHVKSLRSDVKFKKEIEEMKRQKEEDVEQRRQRILRDREQGVNTIISRAVKRRKEREFQEMRRRLMQKEREEQERLKRLMEEQSVNRSQRDAIRFIEWQSRVLRAKETENKHFEKVPSEKSWLRTEDKQTKSHESPQNTKLIQQEQMRRLWVERWQQQLQRLAEDDARKEEEKEHFQKRVSGRKRKMEIYWQKQQERFEKYRRERVEDLMRSPGSRGSPVICPREKKEKSKEESQSLERDLTPLATMHLYNRQKLEASLAERSSEGDEVFIRFNHTNIYLHHRGKLDKAKNYVLLLKSIFEGIKMPKAPSVETVVSCLTQWVEQEACRDYYDVAESMWSILMKTILEELQTCLQKSIYINEKEWVMKARDLKVANRISITVAQMVLDMLGKKLIELISNGEIPPPSTLMEVVFRARDLILQETWQIINAIFRNRISRDKINLWQLAVRQVINKMVFQTILNFIGWMRDRIILWSVIDISKMNNISVALTVTLGTIIAEVARAAIMKSVLDLELSSENIKENFISYFFSLQNPLISSVIAWAEGHLWHFLDSNRRFPRIEEIEQDARQLARSTLELIHGQVSVKLGHYAKPSLEEMLVHIILGGLLNKLQQRLIMNETTSDPSHSFLTHALHNGIISEKASDIVVEVLEVINNATKNLKQDSKDLINHIENSSKGLSDLIFQTVSNVSLDLISKSAASSSSSSRSLIGLKTPPMVQESLLTHLLNISSQVACSYVSRMVFPTESAVEESCSVAVSQIKLSAKRAIKNLCKQRKTNQSTFTGLQTLLGCICHDLVKEMEYKVGRLLELTTSNHIIQIGSITRAATFAFEIEYLDLTLRKLISVIEKNRLKKIKIEADSCQLHESQVSLAVKKEQQWIVKAIIRNIMLRWQELIESNELPSQSAMQKLIDEVVSIANPEGLHEIALRLRYMMEEKLKDTDAKLVQAAEELVGETFFMVCRELWIEGNNEKMKSDLFIAEVIATDDQQSYSVSKASSSSSIFTFQKNAKYDTVLPSIQVNIANLIIKFSKKESSRLIQHVNKLISNKIILREVAFFVVDKALQSSFPGVWCSYHGCHTVWSTPYFEAVLDGIIKYLQEWEEQNKNYFSTLFKFVARESQQYEKTPQNDSDKWVLKDSYSYINNIDRSIESEIAIDPELNKSLNALTSNVSTVKSEYDFMAQNFQSTVALLIDNILLKALSLQNYGEQPKSTMSPNNGRIFSSPKSRPASPSEMEQLELKKSEIQQEVCCLLEKVVNVLSDANQSLNFDPGGALNSNTFVQRNLSSPIESEKLFSSKNAISDCESDIKSVVKSIVDIVSIVISRSSLNDTTETEVENIQQNKTSSGMSDKIISPSSERDAKAVKSPIETNRSVSLIQLSPTEPRQKDKVDSPDTWPIPMIYSIVDNVIHRVVEVLIEKINEASTGRFEAVASLSRLPESPIPNPCSTSTKTDSESEHVRSKDIFTPVEVSPLQNDQTINKNDDIEILSLRYTQDMPNNSRVLNVTPTDFKAKVTFQPRQNLGSSISKEITKLVIENVLQDAVAWEKLQNELCTASSKEASFIVSNYITDQNLKNIFIDNCILPVTDKIGESLTHDSKVLNYLEKETLNQPFSDSQNMKIEGSILKDTCIIDKKSLPNIFLQRNTAVTDSSTNDGFNLSSHRREKILKIPHNLNQENVKSILENIQDIREKIKTVNNVLFYLQNVLNVDESSAEIHKRSESTTSIKSLSDETLSSIQNLIRDEKGNTYVGINETNRMNHPLEVSNKSINFLLAQPSDSEITQNSLSQLHNSERKPKILIQRPTFHTLTLDLVKLSWQHLKRMAEHLRRKRKLDLSQRSVRAKSDAGPMRPLNSEKRPFYRKYFSLNAVCAVNELTNSEVSDRSSSTRRSLVSESILSNERKNQYLIDSLRSTFLEDVMKETVHHFHNNYSKFLAWKEISPTNNKYSLVELQNNMSESLLYFVIHSLQQEIVTRQSIAATIEKLSSDLKPEYWHKKSARHPNLHFTQSAVTNILRETVQKLIEIMKTIYIPDDREENFIKINFDDSSILTTGLANKVINRIQEVAFETVLCNNHLSRALSYEREPASIASELLRQVEYFLQNSKNIFDDLKEVRSRVLQTVISEILTKMDKVQGTMPKKVVSLVKDLLMKVHTEVFKQLAEKELNNQLIADQPNTLVEYKKISAVLPPEITPILSSMTRLQKFQELKHTTGKEVISFLRDAISNMVKEYTKLSHTYSDDKENGETTGQKTEKLVANAIEGVINVLNEELQGLIFGLRRRKEKRVKFDPIVISKEIKDHDARKKGNEKGIPNIKRQQLRSTLNNKEDSSDDDKDSITTTCTQNEMKKFSKVVSNPALKQILIKSSSDSEEDSISDSSIEITKSKDIYIKTNESKLQDDNSKYVNDKDFMKFADNLYRELEITRDDKEGTSVEKENLKNKIINSNYNRWPIPHKEDIDSTLNMKGSDLIDHLDTPKIKSAHSSDFIQSFQNDIKLEDNYLDILQEVNIKADSKNKVKLPLTTKVFTELPFDNKPPLTKNSSVNFNIMLKKSISESNLYSKGPLHLDSEETSDHLFSGSTDEDEEILDLNNLDLSPEEYSAVPANGTAPPDSSSSNSAPNATQE